MVKIKAQPPAEPMFYVEGKSGSTVGHIEKVGGEFTFFPTSIFTPHFTSVDLIDIAEFLEEKNGRS